jgi:rod shape-determining protein MreD
VSVAWLLKSAAAILIVLTVQLELFSDLRIAGVMPELLLGLTVAAAWHGGADRGAFVGFTAGALYDLYLPTPLALTALTYTIVGYAVGIGVEVLAQDAQRMARRLLGAASVACGLVLFMMLGELLGEENLYNDDFPRIVAVATVYTAVLLPLLHLLMRWAMRERGALTPDELRLVK